MVRRVLLIGFLSAFGLCGCGGGGPTPVAIGGKLTWEDGTPIEGATVQFSPKSEKEGGRLASGFSGADGSFTLTTTNAGDGALPGEYVVLVKKIKVFDGGEDPGKMDPTKAMKAFFEKQGKGAKSEKSDIPAAYSSVGTSPLKWKVEGARTDVALKVQKLKS
ncbi:MAG: carboxypeptidase-like regulatory domain-containing protein [Gemmataceae bacterium]|nr:carboxypeptidase-like regulatory domain-containing protein [Gemmataceae bacterium]